MIGTVVIVKVKKKIIFHSGLQKFQEISERDKFNKALYKHYKGKGYSDKEIQVYSVSSNPIEPEEEPKKLRGKHYCPYCGQVNKFKQGEFGSRVCPVCGISEQDFYIKKYNKIK